MYLFESSVAFANSSLANTQKVINIPKSETPKDRHVLAITNVSTVTDLTLKVMGVQI